MLETLNDALRVHQIRLEAPCDVAAGGHAGGVFGNRGGGFHAGDGEQIRAQGVQALRHPTPTSGGRVTGSRCLTQQPDLPKGAVAQIMGAQQAETVGYVQHAFREPAALGRPGLLWRQCLHELTGDGQQLVQQRQHRRGLVGMGPARGGKGRQQSAAGWKHADGGARILAFAHVEEQILHQGRLPIRGTGLLISQTFELTIKLTQKTLDGDAHAPAGVAQKVREGGGGTPQGFLGRALGQHMQTREYFADPSGSGRTLGVVTQPGDESLLIVGA